MKIDLHCHSKHSKRPSLWIMQKLGCPESFTEPLDLYKNALSKGMTAVTITDHNVIDGALEIAHLPNTTLGCEYTTYFPEDRCKIHVLAWGFNEEQHRELSVHRENIYDFTDYLLAQGIQHSCAHPLYGPNDKLSIGHIEKLALLYKVWELNGDMNPTMNDAVECFIRNISQEHIRLLENKHNLKARGEHVWNKVMTAGSDDHSSLNMARCYTEVKGADTFDKFWEGVHSGSAIKHGVDATPKMYARNIYGIAYQFYKTKFDIDRFVPYDPVLQFANSHLCNTAKVNSARFSGIHKLFQRRSKRKTPDQHGSLVDLVRHEARGILESDPQIMRVIRKTDISNEETLDKDWFDFVNAVSNKVFLQLGNRLIERVQNHQLFDLFHTMGSAGALYTVLAPYFATYSIHAQNKSFAKEVLGAFADGQFMPALAATNGRIAHFTDTFFDVNGVSRTLQQQCKSAQKLGKDYTVIACSEEERTIYKGVRIFKGEGRFALPEYAEIQLLAPPLLKILEHCYEAEYTHIHISTPGPMGLAGLAVARILGLPVSGTYHTAFPQYGKLMTEDSHVEDVLWRLMLWFYEQLDFVYAPSSATSDELRERGIRREKIKVYPRGVDTERFTPSMRTGETREKYGISADQKVYLYVGRLSGDKNLQVLVDAFKQLRKDFPDAVLLVVGDGPLRQEMELFLMGEGVVFTGYLSGPDLSKAYADSDIMVFPSLTDTFGNVVLEAQASGVPVIVSDQGGPQENVLDGETGIIVKTMDAKSLANAMAVLGKDDGLRLRMGIEARKHMETRGNFDAAFSNLWDMWLEEHPSPHEIVDAGFMGFNMKNLIQKAG